MGAPVEYRKFVVLTYGLPDEFSEQLYGCQPANQNSGVMALASSNVKRFLFL
jgi:hypothetical protein